MENLEAQLLETLRRYEMLMDELTDRYIAENLVGIYGIIVDRSEHLKALCLVAACCETVEQAADIVGMSLAASWVFQVDWERLIPNASAAPAIATTTLPRHPDTFGALEVQRWEDTRGMRSLSFMLERRIGTCTSYSLTLAIVLKATGLANKVTICSYLHPEGVGHVYVRTETPDHVIDLSARSHGHKHVAPESEVIEVEI